MKNNHKNLVLLIFVATIIMACNQNNIDNATNSKEETNSEFTEVVEASSEIVTDESRFLVDETESHEEDYLIKVNGNNIEKKELGIEMNAIIDDYQLISITKNVDWLIVILDNRDGEYETLIYEIGKDLKLIYENNSRFLQAIPQEDESIVVVMDNMISVLSNGEVIDELAAKIEVAPDSSYGKVIETVVEIIEFSRIDGVFSAIMIRSLIGDSGNPHTHEVFYVSDNSEIKIGEEGVAIAIPSSGITENRKYYVFSDIATPSMDASGGESCLNFIDMGSGESIYKHYFMGYSINQMSNIEGSLRHFEVSANSINYAIQGEGSKKHSYVFEDGQVITKE